VSDEEEPVVVPVERLAAATLRALVEDFCTRDGTDYGAVEKTLEQKVALLMGQLDRGEAHVLFEANSQTLRIVTTAELPEP
jgi:uncharacterized protein YheU (UPF0270 family)